MGVDRDRGLSEEPTLAEALRELANAPTSQGALGRARLRAVTAAENLTTRGTLGPLAELGWAVNRRLQRHGGGALAALLAYRLFVWLLPFALVAVFVVGLVHEGEIDDARAIEEFGLSGFVASSISKATADTGGPGLVSGVIVGGAVLLYMTHALIRSLRVTHALVWGTRLTRIPRPLPTAFAGLAMLTALVLGRSVVDGLGGRLGPLLSPLLAIGSYLVVPALWLIVSTWLPHRGRDWRDLVPGAVFLTAAFVVIHLLIALVLYPYLREKEETYGGLGLAAGILLALYGMGYAITTAATVNAELADRRAARQARLAERRATREATRDATRRLTP